ncbi:MAG: hypothetical protein J5881_02350 [Clostridia bacterium]|nr:hypothetical protein [Clostridia bacterium]
MDVSSMKNIVVLKDLPSNIIDEAIVVLKSNKRVKNLEKIENCKFSGSENDKKKDNKYVLKEAEMLVSDYIAKIDENKKQVKKVNVKRLKTIAFISSTIALLECLLLI